MEDAKPEGPRNTLQNGSNPKSSELCVCIDFSLEVVTWLRVAERTLPEQNSGGVIVD